MKFISSIAAVVALAGAAHAAQPQNSLSPVTVHPAPGNAKSQPYVYTLDCTPPNSATECAAFHRDIRRNFTSREIGMLFGASTAYPESRAAYAKVAARFDAFARGYDELHLTAFASK